jgi:predicted RNase H-like HicB family nuclease
MTKILVIIEKGESFYGAYSPDVPGCVAVGDTREEALQLFREALQETAQKAPVFQAGDEWAFLLWGLGWVGLLPLDNTSV